MPAIETRYINPTAPENLQVLTNHAASMTLEYFTTAVPLLHSMVRRGEGRNRAQNIEAKSDDIHIPIDDVGEEVLRKLLESQEIPVESWGEHSSYSYGMHRRPSLLVAHDPFDNTSQYRKGLDTAPYTVLSFFLPDGTPVAGGSCNLRDETAIVAWDGKAYELDLRKTKGDRNEDPASPPHRVEPSRRGRINYTSSRLASYLGSKKYSLRVFSQFGSLIKSMHDKGVLYPGGGAFIYGDIAAGNIDAYIMPKEPNGETAAGAAILQIAGGTILVIDENSRVQEWKFDPERFYKDENILLAAANPRVALHIMEKFDKAAAKNYKESLIFSRNRANLSTPLDGSLTEISLTRTPQIGTPHGAYE